MRWWYRTRTGYEELEHELRSRRPEPPADFVRRISMRLSPPQRQRTTAYGRVALAVAMTTALLVLAGVLGGLSYAASATSDAASSISHVFVSNGNKPSTTHSSTAGQNSSVSVTPADDQYEKKVLVCHHDGKSGNEQTLLLPESAAEAQIREGVATPGPCP